jgi:hypothetical protein
MKSLLHRTQLRQRPMLAVYVALLLGIALLIGAWCLDWVFSSSNDRLAVIANLLSFGILLLALVAGIVALAAYSAATGQPDLSATVLTYRTSEVPDQIVVTALPQARKPTAAEGNILLIVIENKSGYAARSPAVIVSIKNGCFRREIFSAGEEWVATGSNFLGDIYSVQWDGGANYMIHGKSSRQLPRLELEGLSGSDPLITFQLLADGFSSEEKTLPVLFEAPLPD